MADRVLKFWKSWRETKIKLKDRYFHERNREILFVSQGTPERIYLLKLYLNIDRRIGFLLHPRFHRIMFNSETNRERHARFPSVHVERITGSLTPAGLSSINLARSNAPRCVKYDYYSAPKMSQLVEPSSIRLSRTIDTNFIESLRRVSNESPSTLYQTRCFYILLIFKSLNNLLLLLYNSLNVFSNSFEKRNGRVNLFLKG